MARNRIADFYPEAWHAYLHQGGDDLAWREWLSPETVAEIDATEQARKQQKSPE